MDASDWLYVVVTVFMLATAAGAVGLGIWCWRSVRDLNRARDRRPE